MPGWHLFKTGAKMLPLFKRCSAAQHGVLKKLIAGIISFRITAHKKTGCCGNRLTKKELNAYSTFTFKAAFSL